MNITLNLKNVQKGSDKIKRDIAKIQNKNDKLTKDFIKESKEMLEYISRTAIDKFYEDYEPHMYDRTHQLYNICNVYVDENNWEIKFDPYSMQNTHRADREYIFENSFINGWHGGAIDGEGHPNPGIPYWKFPETKIVAALFSGRNDYYNIYYFGTGSAWYTPAIKSPSPYKEIVRKSEDYMLLATNKYHIQYNENLDLLRRSLNKNLKRML